MPEGTDGSDRPLIADLLDLTESDPTDRDALPRQLLRQSLRRLVDEAGEPQGGFLWFLNDPRKFGDPGDLGPAR
ncbi:hypothetical protein O7606_13945 [Micromonospora sp. WMMD882]|uniref:hypothetical protein n=1 Tax=Micromonospora sp. WMMD882 TaxID=3015151 RepID=UPI00248BE81E|nr:hypothetical protein [Micromonospora sp. WMMD882]WBB77396.1 hypothetical protein O7606_13945 [Micromonospora sp. WMMD882]